MKLGLTTLILPAGAAASEAAGRTLGAHVESDLSGRIDLIVDGGPVEVGVESTIFGCFEAPMLLRPRRPAARENRGRSRRGACRPPADVESDSGQPLAPGMLASHYAPRAQVRLNASDVAPGEALLAFGPNALPGTAGAAVVMNLSASGDLDEAAANLFGYLRSLDARGPRIIAVMPIPEEGLGEAINDRLRRAAVER